MKKKILGILSLGRTDYSYYKPLLQEIKRSSGLDYYLITVGMHLSPEFGQSYREISADGFTIHEKIECTLSSNTAEGSAKTTALMTMGLASTLSKGILDMLIVFGDRFETLGAVVAALPYDLPVAHIWGGDVTEGAFDEQTRHAITKLSHLHFPSNALSARRILQMGEEPWRVCNVGSTAVDMMLSQKLYTKEALCARYGFDPKKRIFLVTYHPVTLEAANTEYHITNLIQALKALDANILITYPNSDPGSRTIIEHLNRFTQEKKLVRFEKKLGIKGYYSAMKHADAMIGNSSSGILESSTYRLPVVNIGNRQKNRLAGINVIHAQYEADDILKKVTRAVSPAFKKIVRRCKSPYGNGKASEKIVRILEKTMKERSTQELVTKKFKLL